MTMDPKRIIPFGVIGCGLMGKEFASAAARWMHLGNLDFQPIIVAACDLDPSGREWFSQNVPSVRLTTADYRDLLADPHIEAIYCAVPHNLHAQIYTDVIRAGKHLLGEKPFGIDLAANRAILAEMRDHPNVLVRCSSEFPFFPGAYQVARWVREECFGQIIEVEAGLWHSSDLDPNKPINWKRITAINGEYGCMGDLGMHPLHLPLRFGWKPLTLRAMLSKIVTERPNREGKRVPCETWDNAILACEVKTPDQKFPMTISTKRIAPGHSNTWFLKVWGTHLSAEFSTRNPKRLFSLPYASGKPQETHVIDVPHVSAYPSITGHIFEFGFSDAILQMWAAFCDELVHPDKMQQWLKCATPEEAAQTHRIFTAALESYKFSSTVQIDWNC
jgi:predicted dehydrogenase